MNSMSTTPGTHYALELFSLQSVQLSASNDPPRGVGTKSGSFLKNSSVVSYVFYFHVHISHKYQVT